MRMVERYSCFLSIARQLENKDLVLLLVLDFLFHKRGKYRGFAADIGNDICRDIRKRRNGDAWCKAALSPRVIGISMKRNIDIFGYTFNCVRLISDGRHKYIFDGIKWNVKIRLLRLALECEIEARQRGRDRLPYNALLWVGVK